jgi:Baseplate J-like protein
MSDTVEPCGCCDGISAETPALISNRPGLTQIGYRVGRHASFKASLLTALSNSNYSPLGLLSTRSDSDFTVALLDAFAITADILTFYQERIANESYLRTATQQRSVFELARLVGYQPSPGVSATAILAFTLNNATGAPDPALIPAATRVQSVPALGQTAAVFETATDLTARIEYNALLPQTTQAVDFSQVTTFLWLAGTGTNLSVGDSILLIDQARFSSTTCDRWAWRTVTAVTPDSVNNRTLVQWTQTLERQVIHIVDRDFGPQSFDARGRRVRVRLYEYTTTEPIFQSASVVSAYALRRRASLFGVNAPDPNMLPVATVPNITGYNGPAPGRFAFLVVAAAAAANNGPPFQDWNFSEVSTGTNQVILDSLYTLSPGLDVSASPPPASPFDPAQFKWIVLSSPQATDQLYAITAVSEISPVAVGLSNKATSLQLDNSNALAGFISNTRSTLALVQSEPLSVAPQPLTPPNAGNPYQYQPWMLAPVTGQTVSVIGGAQLAGGQPVAVSGQRPRLQLQAAASFAPTDTTLAIQPQPGDIFLLDAPPPDPATLPNPPSGTQWSVLTLKGTAGTLTADPAQVLIMPADKSDPTIGEVAVLAASGPSVTGTLATLTFTGALAQIYDRSTFSVNANVVSATHGQTVSEILGNGDATASGQQFQLKQSPLTFVPTASGQGAQSTLQVFVNDLRWSEVANFLASGPSDRAFVTRTARSSTVTVQFGDGTDGARPPSGQMNIRAQYRTGTGLSGMVQAGQLSQAIDRPSGLRSVTNPDPATGGADPDTAQDARQSAPLHVLTLDRVVSLLDYQNFAQAFAGIAKAYATWTWFGQTRGVAVTVSGAGGASVANGPTPGNLTAALLAAGDPYVPVQVLSCQTVLFTIAALLRIDTTLYQTPTVLAAVRAALTQSFSFDARAIGQGVAQSEVIAVIQNVAGVLALELTQFVAQQQAIDWTLQVDGLPDVLPAYVPPPGLRTGPTPGVLLLLDPASLNNLGTWQ